MAPLLIHEETLERRSLQFLFCAAAAKVVFALVTVRARIGFDMDFNQLLARFCHHSLQ